jgi:pyruvate/2-oxoglutarate dehydrogenase complex dihydrolipoamide acyltransferase (E2) component
MLPLQAPSGLRRDPPGSLVDVVEREDAKAKTAQVPQIAEHPSFEDFKERVAKLAAERREAREQAAAQDASHTPQVAVPFRPRLIRTAVDAEIAAADFMRAIGFAGAKRTPSGADGGIDVIAAGVVAQVKTHMKPIGRPDLQRLCGAAKGRTMLFFSLEGYTPEALKWGDLEGMALFRFDLQGEPSPINRAAKALVAAAVTASAKQLEESSYARGPGPWQPLPGWGTLRSCTVVRDDLGATKLNCLFVPDNGGEPRPLTWPVTGNDDPVLSMVGEYARGVLDWPTINIMVRPEFLAEYEQVPISVNALPLAGRASMYAQDNSVHQYCGYGWDPKYRLVKKAPGLVYEAEHISKLFASPKAAAAQQASPPAAVRAVPNSEGLVLSPVVRQLLAEYGIDPTTIPRGTGKGGQVTRADVLDCIDRSHPIPK